MTDSNRKWREANRERLRAQSRAYYQANKELWSERARRRKYGDHVERLWGEQEGRCANPACRKALGTGKRGFHVDHDHRCCPGDSNAVTCGRCVRGLLCADCNESLRSMTPDLLRGLADYLEAHPLKPRDQMRLDL
jgi:hypothetical protein